MRATRVLVPTLLTLAVALWLALRERAPDGAPAIEREHALEDAGPRALPASEPREVAVTRSAEFEAPPPPPPVVEDGGERGQAPPPEVGGGWRDDLAAPGVGRARPRDEQAQARLEPSALPPTARFGAHVALSGTIAAVAAPLADGNGAVYVFERAGSRWNEGARLLLPEDARSAGFGLALDLSGDWLAVGAPGDARTPGAVLFYRRRASAWILAETLASPTPAPGDTFGAGVALSREHLIVSRSPAGPADAFVRTGSWQHADTFSSPGEPLACAIDGQRALRVERSEGHGLLRLYGSRQDGWVELDVLNSALEGMRVALGPRRAATIWSDELAVYEMDAWPETLYLSPLRLPAAREPTRPVALSDQRAFVGNPTDDAAGADAGAVLRFARAGDEWHAERALVARDARDGDLLGTSLAADGPLVIAGAPGGGYALVWELAPPAPRRPGR